MKTPFSSSVNGSGFGELGGDFGLAALGESRRELIRLDGFDSFWASFSSLKYSSPDENGSGGVTRSGQLWSRLLVKSIHDSVELEIFKIISRTERGSRRQKMFAFELFYQGQGAEAAETSIFDEWCSVPCPTLFLPLRVINENISSVSVITRIKWFPPSPTSSNSSSLIVLLVYDLMERTNLFVRCELRVPERRFCSWNKKYSDKKNSSELNVQPLCTFCICNNKEIFLCFHSLSRWMEYFHSVRRARSGNCVHNENVLRISSFCF